MRAVKSFRGYLKPSGTLLAGLVTSLLLFGCGRADVHGPGAGSLPGEAALESGGALGATIALKPVLGTHQVQEYDGNKNVKGTLQVVVQSVSSKDANGNVTAVPEAGIISKKDPSSPGLVPDEEFLTVVSETSFTTKGANITQEWKSPTNANVHKTITYKPKNGQLVITLQNCTVETCQIHTFKVTP